MITRRELLTGALLAGSGLRDLSGKPAMHDDGLHSLAGRLERQHGGQLGVAILDTAKKSLIAYRGHEHFPMCSTHKFLAAANVLARVDRHEESLDRRIHYTKADLVTYSPRTEKHTGDGMTVGELCAAALTLSDNTAANLLLHTLGGPAGVTAFVRAIGDDTTRLDHAEPQLNDYPLGDPHDTTTPLAMLEDLHKLVLGTLLSTASREQLIDWMVGCQTGNTQLRAGVPPDWRVGDKTGSGSAVNNATNDIAVLWPPKRAPLIVTAYYAESHAPTNERHAVLAEVGRYAATFSNGA